MQILHSKILLLHSTAPLFLLLSEAIIVPNYFQGWWDGYMVTSTRCSFKREEFVSQHLYRTFYNNLQL